MGEAAWKRTLVNAVLLPRPPAEVFALVTNPGQWHTWHPNTRDVDAAADHPLTLGEQVVERIRIGSLFRGTVTWVVTACEPGRRWVLAGQASRGFASELEYLLTPEGGGTHFRRRIHVTWPWWFVLGAASARRMGVDAAQALENLKRVLSARA